MQAGKKNLTTQLMRLWFSPNLVFKQTVVDAPNIALDRMMSLMALPCSNKGCLELIYLNKMETHLETCKFRLQPCPNKERGCEVRLQAKVVDTLTHWTPNSNPNPSSGYLLAHETVRTEWSPSPSHPKAVNSKEHRTKTF